MAKEFTYLDYGIGKNLTKPLSNLGLGDPMAMEPVSGVTQPESIGSGDLTASVNLGRDGHIRGGATDYFEGNGLWQGYRSVEQDYGLFFGDAAGNHLRFNTTDGELIIVGSLSVGSDAGGWTITADTLYSLATGTPTSTPTDGIILDSSNPQILIYEDADKRLEIGYLSAGVFGIKGYDGGGSNVLFELSDTQSVIAGWTITTGYIYGLATGTPTSAPNDGVVLASGSTGGLLVYEDTEKRVELGYLASGIFGLKGYATDGTTVTFELSDTQQMLAGWNFTNTVLRTGSTDANSNILIDSANSLMRLGPTTGDYISIDGANKRIRSSDYVSGVAGAGFTLEPDLLEVGNISARGLIRTAVFQKNVISAVGGSFAVIDSDKLNADMTALDASTLTISGNTTFAVGDLLRLKDGTDDEWLEVTNIGSAPIYTVTRDKAAAYGANSNPAWKNGASVVNYGASGEGLVYMTASDPSAPYLSVLTHAGSPWSAVTTQLRLGNLNGYLGYVADTFGLGVGSNGAGEANVTIDPTNGIRIRTGTTNLFSVDMAGGALIAGWNIVDGYLYGLGSGTPTASPNDGVVLASGSTGGLLVYEDLAKRVEVGYLSAGIYGLKVYATNGTTVVFEASDTQQKIAGWIFDDAYLYGLSSGTPTSSPSDGVVLKSGSTGGLIVYEDLAKRVEVGYLSAGIYGIKGYGTDGSTVIFELSDTQQLIGGFSFTDTQLSAVSGGNTTIVSSGTTAFSAGPTGSPTVTITQAGVLTASGAVLSSITFNSIALTTTGAEIIRGYNLSPSFDIDSQNGSSYAVPSGFSDATSKVITFCAASGGAGDDYEELGYAVSEDIGAVIYLQSASGRQSNGAGYTGANDGAIYIGTDYWFGDSSNTQISKNGAGVTISGTARYGSFGHDPTNSYLLVLYSTTKIARFSGISGTTITNIVSDITLDTAVTQTVGFLFDNTNSRYICIDTTNNLLRRFNSSGTTIDTVAYTITDTNIIGLCILTGRVHIVLMYTVDVDTRVAQSFVDLIPTNMRI